MSHVVVLGAGLGGTIMAYELRDAVGFNRPGKGLLDAYNPENGGLIPRLITALGAEHTVSVVTKGTQYSFVPSNPWVAPCARGVA